MAMQLGHVHIKTREDPRKVAQFYVDNFGATVKREIPGRGCQLDLHGVQLNVTTIIADQNHEQDRCRRSTGCAPNRRFALAALNTACVPDCDRSRDDNGASGPSDCVKRTSIVG